MSRTAVERGQAAVELVALLPLVAAAAFALVQVVLVAHADWAATQAAGAAARARAVGGDPAAAARGALPGHLERRLRVADRGGGRVEVVIRAPALVPRLDPGPVAATARFEPQ